MAQSLSDPQAPTLYITYDGLTDPLGQSQILPYLVGLARRGHSIHILSCEKPGRFEKDRATIAAICAAAGLTWHPLRYHRNPPVASTAYDLRQLRREAVRLHRRFRFGLVHCRSYIAAAAGLHLKKRFTVPLLFDMRGFWPEEKTESGSWNLANPLFRIVYAHFKRLERDLLANSDAIVSLTDAGKAQLLGRPELAGHTDEIAVIPCCADFAHFPLVSDATHAAARAEFGLAPDAPVLAYLGSLGGIYMLGEMLDFFSVYRARKPDARFLIITQDEPGPIAEQARARGVDPAELVVRPAARDEVPRFLAAADLGISFIRPSFSKTASSPTKMGEMLAVGLPLVANSGVGDVSRIIRETRCGAAIESFDAASYARAIDEIDGSTVTPQERRHRAAAIYDLDLGVDRYEALYLRFSV